MAYKVFIDGEAGTTGLRLAEKLEKRDDIGLVHIGGDVRKDVGARLERFLEADVCFLCLPDDEAIEIVKAADKAGLQKVRIIDCSTAHRVSDGWSYGMPELIRAKTDDTRIANPGCYATGFIMCVRPLVEAGIIDKDAALSFYALSGYSGAGKAGIAEYEAAGAGSGQGHGGASDGDCETGHDLRAPRRYALPQRHKHLPEIKKYSGLAEEPVFSPMICDFYNGMLTGVPLPRSCLRRGVSPADIREELARYYEGRHVVKVRPLGAEFSESEGGGFLSADAFENRDDIEIMVTGNDDRIEIISRYDNLGKGASGAAIQNMNLSLGLPEEKGLVLGD